MSQQLTEAGVPERDQTAKDTSGMSRRSFLGKAGTMAAAGAAAAIVSDIPLATAAPARARALGGVVIGGGERADQALAIRETAAQAQHHIAQHPDNGDEQAYGSRIGNYTKGLPHNTHGEVDPTAVVASADGSTLSPYTGGGLTVGGELNKLAGNMAMGRAFGGVHWRSDNLVGLWQGEAVALSILADERQTYTETFKEFSLTKFDGTTITI